MRVPETLESGFLESFEKLIEDFLLREGLLSEPGVLRSKRFLIRSVAPHIEKLSKMFNRLPTESGNLTDQTIQPVGLNPYWQKSSNPAHLRLAYFLYFMPPNLFRMASVWSELHRLGFKWASSDKLLRGIEFGAGPATGACGIAAGEKFSPLGLPKEGHFALVEQDKAMLELGGTWASDFFSFNGFTGWNTRRFHRRIDLKAGLLPRSAPKFNLWLMSYFLNEMNLTPQEIAVSLLSAWERHLMDEGVVILVEPALKAESRKLLEIRKYLLLEVARRKIDWLKVLLPCLGHQECGALAEEEDWCHEEVSWWRPPYLKTLDTLVGLDHKSLPFSYLVLVRSERRQEELLPFLDGVNPQKVCRLVSPAHKVGKDLECYICTQNGKRRARVRENLLGEAGCKDFGRGSILIDADWTGDPHATQIQRVEGEK